MTVSILIPFYQAESFIERCARSVLEQTYPDIEYLFIDDASTDNSYFVLQKTLSDYPMRKDSLRIIRNSHNIGLAACRNLAIERCRGSFIFWVDADDWISPANAIQQLVDEQHRTNADIVNAKAVRVYDNKETEFTISSRTSKRDTILGFLNHTIAWAIWGRLIRQSLYQDHGIHCLEGINYNEDFQVAPRLFHYADSVSDLDSVIYHYDSANPFSYTELAKKDPFTRLNRWKNNLSSSLFIQGFFKDKLPEAEAICNEKIAHYLVLIVRESARVGDKRAFMDALKQLKKYDRTYISRDAYALWNFAHFSQSLCWLIKRLSIRLRDPRCGVVHR